MMGMSIGKDKEILLPSNLFKVNKHAVYAFPVAVLIVVLFPVLSESIYTISLYLFLVAVLFLNSTKIIVTRDLIKTVMIMLLGVVIMAYSYDKEPVITFEIQAPDQMLTENMFLTCIICFAIFVLGYLYSITVKRPLKTLRYVLLFQWALVGIYFIIAHGFIVENSLMLGRITIVLLPYMYLVFDEKPRLRFIFSLMVLLYLMALSNRTAFMATTIFLLTYYFYPSLIVKKIRYKLFFLFFILMIFLLIIAYLSESFEFMEDISQKYFGGKSFKQGRDVLWPQLLYYISEHPWYGYGINQSSSFLSSVIYNRDLSSHNIYIEVLLRGGILLLSFFIILFYKIWVSLFSLSNNKMSRLAAAGFLAFLFVGAGLPIGVVDNYVFNTLLWFFWGVASGSAWREDHQI